MMPTVEQILSQCKQIGPCLVWQGSVSSDRSARPIWHVARQVSVPVRRVVLEHRLGEPLPAKHYACCSCPFNSPGCMTHLKALNRQQQMRLASKQGKLVHGEARSALNRKSRHKTAPKMTMERAEALRARRKDGRTYHQLGAEFGIHFSLAARIVNGQAWAPILPPVQVIKTTPGRFEVVGQFERVITNDWLERRPASATA